MNIKQCPFCGGRGEVVESDSGYTVQCQSCGARHGESQIQWRDEGAEAVRMWNTRIKEVQICSETV
jgi:transcription elongation factor Elf1